MSAGTLFRHSCRRRRCRNRALGKCRSHASDTAERHPLGAGACRIGAIQAGGNLNEIVRVDRSNGSCRDDRGSWGTCTGCGVQRQQHDDPVQRWHVSDGDHHEGRLPRAQGHQQVRQWLEFKLVKLQFEQCQQQYGRRRSSATKSAPSTTPAAGGGPDKVWVNTGSKTKAYHCQGDKYYGTTKQGQYMTKAQAESQGYHASKSSKACG
jgi:hypothetical protein